MFSRFTTRTLLVVIAIACGFFAWASHHIHTIHNEAAVAESLKARYRGIVVFTDRSDEAEPGVVERVLHPKRVQRICLIADGMSDSEFKDVCRFRKLENLRLSRTAITAEGVSNIGRLQALRRLNLSRAPIDDEAIAHICQLEDLERLLLTDTRITDTAVSKLSKLTRLELLNIDRTEITASGLDRLRSALPNCKIQHKPKPVAIQSASR